MVSSKRLKCVLLFLACGAACLPDTGNAATTTRTVVAVRTATPPSIDGELSDRDWQRASPAIDFTQRDPEEGKPASERTEIRVLYDDHALYFGCMFYDSDPSWIVARLMRRDDEGESDWGSIRIDTHHDHQNAYEFTFNPAGVKVDILQFDDGDREDESWDAVWEVETRITDKGWTAEVRIPFSMLRYSGDTTAITWGINLIRTISRKKETARWAFTPKKESGFISRFGHLTGLQNLPSPRRLEIRPFVLGRQQWDPASPFHPPSSSFSTTAGLDLKMGIGNNLTLDATFNPDFGQVEADPAVLNLSTFETFYPEKRPFFIEGTQIFQFNTFGGGSGMFYSRRVGRALSEDEVDPPEGGRLVEVPSSLARNYDVSMTLHERRNFDGANLNRDVRLGSALQFWNYWTLQLSSEFGWGEFDDRETRGTGLYAKPMSGAAGAMLETDDREPVSMRVVQQIYWDRKGELALGTEVELELRPSTWMEWELVSEYRNVDGQEAWAANIDLDGKQVSIFGDRRTDELDLQVRGSVTFTRDFTLQLYSQVFLAKGQHDGFRKLVGTSGFVPFAYAGSPDFNSQSLRLNMVARWEYVPGSTLYVVWSQAREGWNVWGVQAS